MGFFEREIDITRNIKLIEWLKSELLMDVSNLFKALVNGFKEDVQGYVAETLANIILLAYILGRRLGLNYQSIEMKMESKIRLGILEEHDVEKFYGDLSALSRHLESQRQRKGNFNNEF